MKTKNEIEKKCRPWESYRKPNFVRAKIIFFGGGDTLRNVIYVGNFVSGKIAPSFFVGPVLFCCFFGWKFSWQLGYFWNQKKYLNKSTMSMIFLYIYGTLNLKKTT